MTKLFKVLDEDGNAFHGGLGKWHLPEGDNPGEWMPPIGGELVPCQNGYHLCRERDLVSWLGPAIYEAEYRGERIDSNDKVVVREARLLRKVTAWNERTARLFACDCAEHILHFFENRRPDDCRPRRAVEVARRYAEGEATDEELNAARNAAKDAGAAAWAAAGAAAWAAAWDAAWTAAEAATCAERQWQSEQLTQYLEGCRDQLTDH